MAGSLDYAALDTFKARLSGQLDEFHIPGVMYAVIKDGQVEHIGGAGFRDLEERLAPDEDTRYCIGSCTKAMTAACLAILKDEGKLGWNDRIRKHWPAFQMKDDIAGQRTTIADALTHMTGIAGHDLAWYSAPDYEGRTTEEYCRTIADLPPCSEPRSHYEYSNLMYTLLGYIVERVSGKPWSQFLEERIFAPLGMTRSFARIKGMDNDANAARPYRFDGQTLNRIPYYEVDAMGGCGVVTSTAADMSKWVAFMLGDGSWQGLRIINEETMRELRAPRVIPESAKLPHTLQTTYGFGWGGSAYRGHTRVNHGGAIDGFGCAVLLFPDDNMGVVTFGNADGSFAHGAAASALADLLLGVDDTDWFEFYNNALDGMHAGLDKQWADLLAKINPAAPPTHPLEDYVGEYTAPGYGDINVSLTVDDGKDKLLVRYNGMPMPLTCVAYDAFLTHYCVDGAKMPLTLAFRMNLEGQVQSVEADMEPRVGPIKFERKKEEVNL
ncbi:penicillin-binding protein [Clostridia bacterium]|nr:penicillin-binding protein [Clostridia bacterium]